MKNLLVLVFCVISSCKANDFLCQIYDENAKYLQRYCINYKEIHPEDCSKQIYLAEPAEVRRLKIGGCDSDTVSAEVKLFRNLHHLDISYSEFESLDWFNWNLERLEIFNASHNKILNIPWDFLKNAPEAREIDLSHNQLTEIASHYFKEAHKLVNVHLSHNKIQMELYGFHNSPNLEYVDLKNNDLPWPPKFAANKYLKTVHLEENPIENFYCFPLLDVRSVSVFISWKNLVEFSADAGCSNGAKFRVITNSNIDSILSVSRGKRQFHCNGQSFTGLVYFKVGHNTFENGAEIIQCLGAPLETINNQMQSTGARREFHSTRNGISLYQNQNNHDSKLKELDLSGNIVGKLNASAFERLINLNHLSLSQTNLPDFDIYTLNSQNRLKVLDISKNHLGFINNISLLNNFNLEDLNIAENDLRSTSEIIQNLRSSLRKLDLAGNHVGKLNATTFDHLTELTSLNLSNTLLLLPETNPFQQLHHLTVLDISSNYMENANLVILSPTLNKLSEFYAANCQIKNPSQVIQQFGPSLTKLDLHGTDVRALNPQSFQKLINLVYLNLRGTHLSSVDFRELLHQRNLQILDISDNELTEMDLRSKGLLMSNLDGDGLVRVENLQQYLPHLEYIGITKNQLPCSHLKYIMDNWLNGLRYLDDPWNQKHGENCRTESEGFFSSLKFW